MAFPPFPNVSLPWERWFPPAWQVQEISGDPWAAHPSTPWTAALSHRAAAHPYTHFCYFSAPAHLFDRVSSQYHKWASAFWSPLPWPRAACLSLVQASFQFLMQEGHSWKTELIILSHWHTLASEDFCTPFSFNLLVQLPQVCPCFPLLNWLFISQYRLQVLKPDLPLFHLK